MPRQLATWFLVCTVVAPVARAQAVLDSLYPPPRQAYVRPQYSAVFSVHPSHRLFLDPRQPAREYAAIVNARLRSRGLDTLAVRTWRPGDTARTGIVLGVGGDVVDSLLARVPDQPIRVTRAYPGAEGYVLDVMPRRVIIAGSDERGLYYGIDSFFQLLDAGIDGKSIRACRVVDVPEFPLRWFYYSVNILVGGNIDRAKPVWDVAARYRLNGVNLVDSKFSRLTTLPERYFDSLKALRDYAAQRRMDIVPGVMPFGYSNSLLSHNPNLASGLPVRHQRFLVAGDTARLLPRLDVSMPNGGFEQFHGNTFPGFLFIDDPGSISFVDTVVKHSGRASVRFQDFAQYDPDHGHGRVSYWRNVTPFTYYKVTGWVRTENLAPDGVARVAVLGNAGYPLLYYDPRIPATTKGWRKVEYVFNSLEADTIGLYWGVWGAKSGRIWWDDLAIEEVAFVNLLRRPGTPVVVTDPGLKTVFREGVDYDTLRDPLLGREPYGGSYKPLHRPPTFRVRPGGRLTNGDTILVSYYHAIIINRWQVMITMSDPEVYEIVEREFRVLDSVLHADTYFMMHDEIRVMNWDEGDRSRGLTPAQILADNVQKCVDIIQRTHPGAKMWVWSDMFDEFHNAVAGNYYLVNGDLRGSADLIPDSIGIVNWNGRDGIVQNSLSFFSSKGFRQISAPYYDRDENQIRRWKEWTREVPDFHGMMYTTWQRKYTHLPAFGYYAWNHAPHVYHAPPLAFTPGRDLSLDVRVTGDPWDGNWDLVRLEVKWRTRPGGAFSTVSLPPKPGLVQTAVIPVPAGARWLQWYVEAEDTRGWTTKVPLGDSVYYSLGSLVTDVQARKPARTFILYNVYPNPVARDDILHLEWYVAKPGAGRIVIQDMLGRTRMTGVLSSSVPGLREKRIDVSTLGRGMFIVMVQWNGHVAVRRFVKGSGSR